MTERPILFSGPMVKAILDGRKTMTRRIYTNRKHPDFGCDMAASELVREPLHIIERACPFGQPGDRLWVRETCRYEDTFYRGADKLPDCFRAKIEYAADKAVVVKDVHLEHWRMSCEDRADSWRPSIHMPRWACRILLEVVSVRVERLQDISEEDARAEGAEQKLGHFANGGPGNAWHFGFDPKTEKYLGHASTAKEGFGLLWESTYGRESWDANPWVWVVEFKRVEA